jgi:microcompartment protein CcmK/EutM
MKWLIVRALRLDRKPLDAFVVAVDAVGAGMGETVLVTQGSSARQTELTTNKPVDAVIVAIVDDLDVVEKQDWAAFDRRTVADLAGPADGS